VDITYYDSGYIDPNYYVYTADAFVDLGQFIVEDYLDADYFENTGVRITLTCEGTRVRFVEASADLVADFSQSVNGVIDVRAEVTLSSIVNLSSQEIRVREFNSDLVSEFTHTAAASATLRSQVTFSSIASQLTVAFQNATGTITMETLVTVTAIVGVIKTATVGTIFSTGLDTSTGSYEIENVPPQSYDPDFGSGYVMAFWAKRDTITSGNYAYSMLAPTTFGDTSAQYNLLQFKNGTGPTSGGGSRSYAHSITLFTPWNLQSNPYWDNTVSQDIGWHHYLIRYLPVTVGGGTLHQYTLYVDGQSQGTSNGSNALRVNSGAGVYFGTGWSSPNPTANLVAAGNFDGAMAQVWLGGVTNFSTAQFYNNGPVDLTGFESPEQYNLLTDPWTDVTASGTKSASSEPLYFGINPITFTLTAQPEAVLLVVVELASQSELAVTATKNVDVAVTLSTEFTTVTDNQTLRLTTATLSTESQLVCLVTVQRSSAVELTASSTVTVDLTRIFAFTADLSSAFTATATVGEITEFSISLQSQFTQVTVISRTRDLASAQESVATVTAQIDDRLRDQSVSMSSAVTLTATYTRIPAISATLTSQFQLQGDAEKFVVAFGTLSVVFTQSTVAFKTIFGSATLVVEAFELTQGDILNFDPCREIRVESETRLAKILPESRLLIVESETRRLKVPQETRVLRVDYETRVNTIKC